MLQLLNLRSLYMLICSYSLGADHFTFGGDMVFWKKGKNCCRLWKKVICCFKGGKIEFALSESVCLRNPSFILSLLKKQTSLLF